MKRKTAALLLSGIMLASAVLGGCAGKENSGDKTALGTDGDGLQTEDNKRNEPVQDEKEGKNKLVIALETSNFVTDYEDNYLTHYLEEKLGIDIEFYMLTGEWQTKVSLMVNSGEELPDILMANNLPTATILDYGMNGILMPLQEYLADADLMPNYNAISEEDRASMALAQTAADGNVYSLSNWEPFSWNMTPFRMYINQAWLDKLNLKMPSTTEELKEVLIAFRDSDPNGNGIQDEIAYGIINMGGSNLLTALMNSFIYYDEMQYNGFSLDESGETVIAPYTTDEWKQGLMYLNDLYNEKLLSTAMFTDDGTQFKATLNQEDNVIGLVSMLSYGNYTDADNNPNFQEMILMEPVKGPEGVSYTPFTVYSPAQLFYVFDTEDSREKIELIMKFADEFYDEKTSKITRFGEEEVQWTMDPEKLTGLTNPYIEAGAADKVTFGLIEDIWSKETNITWHNVSPRYTKVHETVVRAILGTEYDPARKSLETQRRCYELYYNRHPEKLLPVLKYTVEETRKIQDFGAAIKDYINQSMAEFVTGARDFGDGWDTYLAELENIGLSGALEVSQSAYDRVK